MLTLLPGLRTFLRRPLGRYLVIGVSVYLLELAVIIVMERSGAAPTLAVAAGFWAGLVVSFVLQKVITFGDKTFHHRILLPQVVAFSLLVLFNFGFTIGMTALLSGLLPATVIRTVALGITTVWNFYIYKTSIFKPRA